MTVLVNAHTHLEHSWAAKFRPRGTQRFPQWLRRTLQRNAIAQNGDDYEQRQLVAVEESLVDLLEIGVTHIGDVTVSGITIEPLLASGLRGVVYIELLGLEEGVDIFMFQRAVQLLDHYRPLARNGLKIGLSAAATYSVTAAVLEQTAAFCIAEDVPLCMHVGESVYEQDALNGEGPLYHLPIQLGGTVHPPVYEGSVWRYLETVGVLDTAPLLVHTAEIDEEGLDLLARYQAKVVHCPRSNQLWQSGRMPLEKMLERGIPVALGTESLTAAPSLDVREEAAVAVKWHKEYLESEQIYQLLSNTAVFE